LFSPGLSLCFFSRDGGHEQLISNDGRFKPAFAERDKCKPVLLALSLAGNLVKPLLSLYGTEWRERGYGLRHTFSIFFGTVKAAQQNITFKFSHQL
jgi:hypothetical protein